jgi:phage terminase small subunit
MRRNLRMAKPKSVDALKKQEEEVNAQNAKLGRLIEQFDCPPEMPPVTKDEWRRVVGELLALL